MHFIFIAMKQWKFRNHCDEAMNLRWKNFLDFWALKLKKYSSPFFLLHFYASILSKKLIFAWNFLQKELKFFKKLKCDEFPFSLQWIFIARIFFIAMKSLHAYMYNTEYILEENRRACSIVGGWKKEDILCSLLLSPIIRSAATNSPTKKAKSQSIV